MKKIEACAIVEKKLVIVTVRIIAGWKMGYEKLGVEETLEREFMSGRHEY